MNIPNHLLEALTPLFDEYKLQQKEVQLQKRIFVVTSVEEVITEEDYGYDVLRVIDEDNAGCTVLDNLEQYPDIGDVIPELIEYLGGNYDISDIANLSEYFSDKTEGWDTYEYVDNLIELVNDQFLSSLTKLYFKHVDVPTEYFLTRSSAEKYVQEKSHRLRNPKVVPTPITRSHDFMVLFELLDHLTKEVEA